MSKIDPKLLAGLRVGDVVRVNSPIFHKPNQSEEHVVKITKIDNVEAHVNRDGKFSLPVVHWEPREQDFIELVEGHKDNVAWCNAAYVTEIIERCPYVVDHNQIQNGLYNPERSSRMDRVFATRHADCVAIDIRSLAQIIVSKERDVVIRYGLDDEKLTAEWEKAGCLGLRGYQTYSSEGVLPYKPRHGSVSTWMHKPTFKKWLLKRLSHVIRTKKEYRADLIEFQRREEQDYYSDAA